MQTADYWIDHLKLQAHPEGGFYKETYRSKEKIPHAALPDRFVDTRVFSTAIYFLLRSEDRSVFHRIQSDELWHYHAGASLSIYVLKNDKLSVHKLGADVDKGESLQVIVPARCWFGANVEQPDAYSLSGCTVAPGFEFQDFEMANREDLIKEFPAHRQTIERLT
jgi:uncharacterized protein